MTIDPWYLECLVCPREASALAYDGQCLVCRNGHRFPVVEGVPVMLLDDAVQTMDLAYASLKSAEQRPSDGVYLESLGISDEERRALAAVVAKPGDKRIDPVASYLIGATNGIAYRHLIGRLTDYPIPVLRLPAGGGRTFCEIGSNWGRWCVAAARKGYRAIGVDPSLGAVLAAKRIARELGLDIKYVVGDGRFLPFRAGSLDTVFSYSVLQHFSRDDAAAAVGQIRRVLRPGGLSLVQMPTVFGVRCLYHQARRRFREPVGFEVRYRTIPELRRQFSVIGPTRVTADCYLGIGLQYCDRHFVAPKYKVVLAVSELLRRASIVARPFVYVADSVYLESVKESRAAGSRSPRE